MIPVYQEALSRRGFLSTAAGTLGLSMSGWLDRLAVQAATDGTRRKSCILLWLNGGPSHTDTFDPKPDGRVEVRGDFAVNGMEPGMNLADRFRVSTGQWQTWPTGD
jgi:hypothetical protein